MKFFDKLFGKKAKNKPVVDKVQPDPYQALLSRLEVLQQETKHILAQESPITSEQCSQMNENLNNIKKDINRYIQQNIFNMPSLEMLDLQAQQLENVSQNPLKC